MNRDLVLFPISHATCQVIRHSESLAIAELVFGCDELLNRPSHLWKSKTSPLELDYLDSSYARWNVPKA